MMSLKQLSPALKITLIYVILGLLWIAFSDYLLMSLADGVDQMRLAQTYKGWVYVLATGILLFFLVRNSLRKQSAAREFTEFMGGQIYVASEPGNGSVFTFTVPYQPVKRFNQSGISEN